MKPVDIEQCGTYIELSIQAATKNYCNKTTPIQLLSDMFDMITLNECESLFGTIEKNIALWKSEEFFTPIRNNLLRICNGNILNENNLRMKTSRMPGWFHFRFAAKTVPISEHCFLWPNSALLSQVFPRVRTFWAECRLGIQSGEYDRIQHGRRSCG